MTPDPPSTSPQHLDLVSWDTLVEALGPASCIVVIDSWMGQAVTSEVSPEDIWQEALFLAWRDREQHEWRGVGAHPRGRRAIARPRKPPHPPRPPAPPPGGGA
ncbi:MAG: hypothetical protein P1V81_08610, partial [Planctomycetota bacterium]|nr:hypothetical protein [Planctomycetota bacterium]